MKRGLISILFLFVLISLAFPSFAMAAPAARPCGSANVRINYPQGNSIVSGSVTVSGSASLGGSDFQRYELSFSSLGRDAWFQLARDRREIVNGQLGVWDTGLLPDGAYVLRVRAVDRAAQYCEAFASPIYVQRNGGQAEVPTSAPLPPSNTNNSFQQPTVRPTLGPNFDNQNSLVPTNTPRGSRRGTPTFTPTATPVPPTATPAGPTPVPTGIPTIAISIPTDAPVATAEATETPEATARSRSAGASLVPIDLGPIGASIGNALAGLASSFVLGVKLTASAFLLIGAVVFLRRTI